MISRDVVLTNSHCIFDKETKHPFRHPIVFEPSVIQNVSPDKATVVSYDYGWKSDYENPTNDWALLKLDQPLGDIYGYMGWRSVDFSDLQNRTKFEESIAVAGYSSDFPRNSRLSNPGETAGADTACSIVDTKPGLLFHDCDTYKGASGSPIFALFDDGYYYIVGLHAGYTPLVRRIRLPDGNTTAIINQGVQVTQWWNHAAAMTRPPQ